MTSRGFDGKVVLLLRGRTRVAAYFCSAPARTLFTAIGGEPGGGEKEGSGTGGAA